MQDPTSTLHHVTVSITVDIIIVCSVMFVWFTALKYRVGALEISFTIFIIDHIIMCSVCLVQCFKLLGRRFRNFLCYFYY